MKIYITQVKDGKILGQNEVGYYDTAGKSTLPAPLDRFLRREVRRGQRKVATGGNDGKRWYDEIVTVTTANIERFIASALYDFPGREVFRISRVI
jgi:hypothetical protein